MTTWIGSLISLEIRKILAYRSDFWISFVGQVLIQFLIAKSFWTAIFESKGVQEINGFSLELMTSYYLIMPIANKVLTGENIGFLSREIYDGTFSRYLILPLNFFKYKFTTYLTHSCFFILQLLIVLIVSRTQLQFDALFFGLLTLFFGAITYFFMSITIELISLWADNIWSLMVMLRFLATFLGGSLIPLELYPSFIMNICLFTPFPYILSAPVRLIMGLDSTDVMLKVWGILFIWSASFFLISLLVWKKGQYRFQGVGS